MRWRSTGGRPDRADDSGRPLWGLPLRRYLIMIFLASLTLTSLTWTKYAGSFQMSGEARVAKFHVEIAKEVLGGGGEAVTELAVGESLYGGIHIFNDGETDILCTPEVVSSNTGSAVRFEPATVQIPAGGDPVRIAVIIDSPAEVNLEKEVLVRVIAEQVD